MIKIKAVGGYSEFGRNMTAVRVDDEVVIIDMGLHMENYIRLQGDEDGDKISTKRLLQENAIPYFPLIDDWKKDVKAIIPTHAHLDHVGAIPHIASKFDAEILCTPFTAEVIKAISSDKRIKLKNKIKPINPNANYKISDNITAEFIHVTHSTPQTAMIALHTPYGTIVYANDFKFDSQPVLGARPNFERLKSIDYVRGLIVDCTRAWDEKKTPSETVVKEMLRDVLLGMDSGGKLVVVTTFASHLARLKTIIEMGKQLGRKVVMLGRSLDKYVSAGEAAEVIDFSDIERVKFRDKIRKKLKVVMQRPQDYLLIVTGHQGEPEAILANMVYGNLKFPFRKEDQVIFSCSVIPNDENIKNREELELKLKEKHVRIFKDIHASGHAAREELRDLLNMLKPKDLIPAHGHREMMESFRELAKSMGYTDEQLHLIKNGETVKLD